jgi:hypothetical protein
MLHKIYYLRLTVNNWIITVARIAIIPKVAEKFRAVAIFSLHFKEIP